MYFINVYIVDHMICFILIKYMYAINYGNACSVTGYVFFFSVNTFHEENISILVQDPSVRYII